MKRFPAHSFHVEALSIDRNYRQIFKPLTFQLESGEGLYIQGENGVGKTTSLRVLAGISRRYSGKIQLDQWECREWGYQYARHILYLGHHLSLKNDLTALDNIQLLLKIRGIEVEEATILSIFDQLNIPRHPRPIRFLSAGQRRRVALSRLWLEKKPIWILDEPFTSLDWQTIERLEEHFSTHQKEGGILLFTSHQAPSEQCYNRTLTVEANHD